MKYDRGICSLNKVQLLPTWAYPRELWEQPCRIGRDSPDEEVEEPRIFVTRGQVLWGGILKEDLSVNVYKVKVGTDALGKQLTQSVLVWTMATVVHRYCGDLARGVVLIRVK